MTQSHPEPFVVAPKGDQIQSFILLHGLGSNGEKFGTGLLQTGCTSQGQKLQDVFPDAKFIFPTAKKRRSSAFRRATLNQWFDIASLPDPEYKKETQYQGLADSAAFIYTIIAHEVQQLGASNVILGGISHGCAMSLSVLLCLDHPLGGFIGMSGWLPFQRDLEEIMNSHELTNEAEEDPFEQYERTDADASHVPILEALTFAHDNLSREVGSYKDLVSPLSTPVFIGHGDADEKVGIQLGIDLCRTLKLLDMDVSWKEYKDLGHWYEIPREIDDIVDFIMLQTSFFVRNMPCQKSTKV